MRSVSVRLCDLQKVTIPIGYVGENEYTKVIVDCKKIFDEHPNAVAGLIVAPPEGDEYPAVAVRDGNYVIWNVTASDLIYEGFGEIQFTFTIDGTIIGKSGRGRINVEKSLDPSGEVPTPIENWIDEANEILGEAEAAATAIEEMTVEAETLPSGSSASAVISDVNLHKHIVFGIPVGEQGQQGNPGVSAYVHIRYSTNAPTQNSDMHTTPDNWIGIYSGTSSTAPTSYTSYTWYKYKGDPNYLVFTDDGSGEVTMSYENLSDGTGVTF